MLRELKNLIAFLTIIPVGMNSNYFIDAANYMYLFPLVGALIGLLAGTLAWFLSNILPALIVGILTLGFILLVTGLHHTDGLLDFGDGIMYQGPPAKKIEIMHDHNTGTGGLALGLISILTTAFCIAELDVGIVIQSLIVSEVSAKLAMVSEAWIGRSASSGLNTGFISSMHGQYRKLRLLCALIISFGTAVPLLHIVGFAGLISGVVTALIIVGFSNRHFNGVTGDVFGATNELARMITLISILAMILWV